MVIDIYNDLKHIIGKYTDVMYINKTNYKFFPINNIDDIFIRKCVYLNIDMFEYYFKKIKFDFDLYGKFLLLNDNLYKKYSDKLKMDFDFVWEAMMCACRTGLIKIIKRLINISRTKNFTFNVSEFLPISVRGGIKTFKLVYVTEDLFEDANHNEIFESIIVACRFNQNEIVKILLKDKRLTSILFNSKPITIAIKNNNLELVKILLNEKNIASYIFETKKIYFHSIKLACTLQRIEILKLFLKDKRITGQPALYGIFSVETLDNPVSFKMYKMLKKIGLYNPFF